MSEDRTTNYAKATLTDPPESVGRYIRKACERHLADLEASKTVDFEYTFDVEAAERFLNFCPLIKHWQGPAAGELFKLEPWQAFIFGSVYGWRHKETDLRRFRIAFIYIPRKNGKTLMVAAPICYALFAEGEGGPEIYCCATKRDQAKKAYDNVRVTLESVPAFKKRSKIFFDRIEVPKCRGLVKPLPADAKRLDGLNPYLAVFDEIHEFKDSSLWDVMQSGIGARSQPLTWGITTAGEDEASFCGALLKQSQAVLTDPEGNRNDHLFAFLAMADEDDNWENEATWQKANPNLGVSKTIDSMRAEYLDAKQRGPDKVADFKRKQLNIFTQAAGQWLNISNFDECPKEIDREKLYGCSGYFGVDCAVWDDFNCLSLTFPKGEVYDEVTVIPFIYIPEDATKKHPKRDKKLLYNIRRWVDRGFIRTTPGNAIDYEWIIQDISRELNQLGVSVIEYVFDPRFASHPASLLEKEGETLIQFRQTPSNYTEPMTMYEKLINTRGIRTDGNPAYRWMVGNMVAKYYPDGAMIPDKQRSSEKIDGPVSTIMALARLINEDSGSIYEGRDLITL